MQVGRRGGAVVAILSIASAARAEPPLAVPAPPPPGATAQPSGAVVGAPPGGAASMPGVPATAPAAPPSADEPAPPPAGPPHVQRPPTAVGDPYTEPVPVWMVGDDGETAQVSLYPDWTTPGSVPPLASCKLPCGFQMQRGRYRLEVAETDTTLGGSRPVTIDGPSRLTITPRDHAKRTTGLILGIGGAVAVIAGIGLIIDGARNRYQCRSDFCSDSNFDGTETGAGLLVFLGGAALTPIGWVMYGKSFRPAVDVEHGAPSTAAPYGRLGLVGVPSGAGLGGTFVF